MRGIPAGLDIRNLNNENIIFSTITDRVQTGKNAINAHLVEIAREHKILSTKQKPAMIPQDVENSLPREAACPTLEQQV